MVMGAVVIAELMHMVVIDEFHWGGSLLDVATAEFTTTSRLASVDCLRVICHVCSPATTFLVIRARDH